MEDPPGARWADGHDVQIEHHEGQPSISLKGVIEMEANDGILFPILEPVVAGDFSVVLIGLSVSFPPLIELARADCGPSDESIDGDLSLLGPKGEEVDHGIAGIVWDPPSLQIPPIFFFNVMCSSMSSERTSSLRRSLASSAAIFASS